MKNILVVGGAGYIGSHTVIELVNAGYTPIILDDFSNSEKSVLPRLKKILGTDILCIELDYQDSLRLEQLFEEHKIDGVIHFAAFKSVSESVADPLKYYKNNVSGFVGLLDVLSKHKIDKLVLSSSAAVYGQPAEEVVIEEAVCNPTSPYGWSKYFDEIILNDFSKSNADFRSTALRYFNVVGAHSSGLIGEMPIGKPQNLLPVIVQSITTKNRLTIFGDDYPTKDGTCERDYVHVTDLAKAHVSALDRLFDTKTDFSVYNIGTGKPTSVLELIGTFEKANKVKVDYAVGPRRPGDPAGFYASAKKAKQELNWHSEKTIEDAVKDAWDWQNTLNKEG